MPNLFRDDIEFIAYDRLKHGLVYELQSRNLAIGVWNSKIDGFTGIRTKFNSRYLDTEYERSVGGSARAIAIAGRVPLGLDLAESFGAATDDGRYVQWDKDRACWVYKDNFTAVPQDDRVFTVHNDYLFKLLDDIEENWRSLNG